MKIQDPNLAGVNITSTLKTTSTEKVGAGSRGQGTSGGREATDEVSLSGLAKQIESQQSTSPERLAKIERLEAAVQSGAYQPDSGATARSIVADAFQKD